MILSFADKKTLAVFKGLYVKSLAKPLQEAAFRKLLQLDAAIAIDDMRVPPGNRLEVLSGDRAGQWSIRINEQWRICFVWDGQHAYEVEIVDYH